MTFYKFGMGLGGNGDDGGQDDSAMPDGIGDDTVACVEAIKNVLLEYTGKYDNPLHKTALMHVSTLKVMEAVIGTVVALPEPMRTAVAKMFFELINGKQGLIIQIGALARLAGKAVDRGDGTFELRGGEGGDE